MGEIMEKVTRSSRPDVRNPVLALPAVKRLLALPEPSRHALRDCLVDLRKDAKSRAELSWKKSKGPMALYWKTISVYSGHLARALR